MRRFSAVGLLLLVCAGCQSTALRDVDVLVLGIRAQDLSEEEAAQPNWFRFFAEKEQVWFQSSTDEEPYADFLTIKKDCEAYLERTRPYLKSLNLKVDYCAHHARLWVLVYGPAPPLSANVSYFGCSGTLFYDSLKRKVLAETRVD
jgi:hypothetical protein